MTTAAAATAFWINHEHDRETASDGVSRYGYYVRHRIPGGFAEIWDGTFECWRAERFAALAWDTATGPVMAPPYVDWRTPVLSAKFGPGYDGDSAGLIATVEIASHWPQTRGRGHLGGQYWRSWPRERSWDGDEYARDPYGDEVARGGYYALASLRLMFPIPPELLPPAPRAQHHRGEVEETARRAVSALAAELNRVVSPVLATLERS